jgi:hypothetical protein
MSRPVSPHDLLATERILVAAMTDLGFGRFEFLRIERGELVLYPWPCVVREVKFFPNDSGTSNAPHVDFELAPQVAELFEYIREVDSSEIRTLEVEHGLPFSMEIEMAGKGRRA